MFHIPMSSPMMKRMFGFVVRRLSWSDSGKKRGTTTNARLYEAPAALRAVLAPASGESTLEQIKLQTETLNAELKPVELAKRTKGWCQMASPSA
jgi:hypothetical protein